jgi:hypothetical protein
MDQPTMYPDRLRQRAGHPTEAQRLPAAPPMQIITKGWWSRPDEEVTAEELERADQVAR